MRLEAEPEPEPALRGELGPLPELPAGSAERGLPVGEPVAERRGAEQVGAGRVSAVAARVWSPVLRAGKLPIARARSESADDHRP